MFLWWIAIPLIFQHLQRRYQLCPGKARLNNLIHIAAAGSNVRIGKHLSIFGDKLFTPLIGIIRFIDRVLKQDIDRSFRAHHRDFRRGPGIIDVASHVLTIHHVIGPSVGLARNHRDLGHRRFAVGIEQLGPVANDAVVFLADPWQETWHIHKGNQRDIEAVAEAHKTRGLVR